jgi:hypothetical protein
MAKQGRSQLGENDPLLILVLAFAVRIANLAGFIGAEEQNQAQPLGGCKSLLES